MTYVNCHSNKEIIVFFPEQLMYHEHITGRASDDHLCESDAMIYTHFDILIISPSALVPSVFYDVINAIYKLNYNR